MNQSDVRPNCRLFILGGKGKTEDEFRELFSKYGDVKDVWILKDKRTNEDKGVVYITYAKASMAALAREEMNAHIMPGQKTPLKVLIANDRREGSVREPQEDDKNLRIFIKVPKSMTEKEIEEKFKEYGEVEHVNILKEKGSGESKGLAYVRYTRAYHAALAVENVDPSFKAIFAARKVPRNNNNDHTPMDMDMGSGPFGVGGGGGGRGGRGLDDHHGMPPLSGGHMDTFSGYPVDGETRLEVVVPSMVTQEQLFRLFDLVPGLDFCNLEVQSGVAYVRYANAQAAAYARDKLNGFEYPPSYRLAVRYSSHRASARDSSVRDYGSSSHMERDRERVDTMASDLNQNMTSILSQPLLQDNIQSLVNSIKQATSVLTQVGVTPGLSPQQTSSGHSSGHQLSPHSSGLRNGEVRVRYTNVIVPEKQPLLARDSSVAERLFIVSQPEAFSEQVLIDCFSRFGTLIDAYFMPGKNYGYAKFGSAECAKRAIDTMHSQTVCGQRLKVMLADPPKYTDDYDSPNKRPRS